MFQSYRFSRSVKSPYAKHLCKFVLFNCTGNFLPLKIQKSEKGGTFLAGFSTGSIYAETLLRKILSSAYADPRCCSGDQEHSINRIREHIDS